MAQNANNKQKVLDPNWVENKLCVVLGRALITPYNWSLILMTILIWSFGGSIFMYSANANFDMSVVVNEYARNISMFAIAVGFFFSTKRSNILVGLGVGNYLLCLGSIVMSKTLFLQGMVGELCFKPLSILCFLLLLKNIWILAVDRAVNNAVK